MATTVKKVAAALKRAGRWASIEKGNAPGEVVVNSIACWSVREALAAVPANRDDGDRDYERAAREFRERCAYGDPTAIGWAEQ